MMNLVFISRSARSARRWLAADENEVRSLRASIWSCAPCGCVRGMEDGRTTAPPSQGGDGRWSGISAT